MILTTIIAERGGGISAPDAGSDAECGRVLLRHGFVAVREKLLPSKLAKADLRCVEMALPAQLTATARRRATV